jgi:hypothetical protein
MPAVVLAMLRLREEALVSDDPACLLCARNARYLAPFETCPEHPFAFTTFANPEAPLPIVTMAEIRRTAILIRNSKRFRDK